MLAALAFAALLVKQIASAILLHELSIAIAQLSLAQLVLGFLRQSQPQAHRARHSQYHRSDFRWLLLTCQLYPERVLLPLLQLPGQSHPAERDHDHPGPSNSAIVLRTGGSLAGGCSVAL